MRCQMFYIEKTIIEIWKRFFATPKQMKSNQLMVEKCDHEYQF